MKNVTVYSGSANGVIAAPASIEEALPAIVLAAITGTSVRGVGKSPETISMFNGLFALGARFRQQDDIVTFYSAPKEGAATIECTNKVLGLLLPLCSVLGGEYTFLGEYHRDIFSGIESPGIVCAVSERGVTIKANRNVHDVVLHDEMFAGGFVLALPLMGGAKVACDCGKKALVLTLAIMRGFGFDVSETDGYAITKQREAVAGYVYSVGGDYGKAAYLLLAGFVSGEVGVTGLLSDSLQPKHRVVQELKDMRLYMQEMNGAVFAKKSRMSEEVVDVSGLAEPPVVLALACFCKGKCVIKNAGLLEAKRRAEFDLTVKGLQSIGADIIKIGDELFITGRKKLFGGNVDARGSVNAATALAAAGLCSEIGVTLSNAPVMDELAALGITLQ